ncbi:MAG: DUF3987 domain-containing protein [Thermoproteota archaeon]
MTKKDVVLTLSTGKTFKPNLWAILLAPSGVGKTTVLEDLQANVFDDFNIAEQTLDTTDAKFIEDLSQAPKGIVIEDEIAETFERIQTDPTRAGLKTYLLKMYKGKRITRKTKTDGIVVVENPTYSLLGITIEKSLQTHIKPEWIVDGFLSRMVFMTVSGIDWLNNFPRGSEYERRDKYNIDFYPLKEKMISFYNRLRPSYKLPESFFYKEYDILLGEILDLVKTINDFTGFITRFSDVAKKNALLFHTLINPDDEMISNQAVLKGIDLSRRFFSDIQKVLSFYSTTKNAFNRLRALQELELKKGEPLTRRDVMRHTNHLSKEEVDAYLKVLKSLKNEKSTDLN